MQSSGKAPLSAGGQSRFQIYVFLGSVISTDLTKKKKKRGGVGKGSMLSGGSGGQASLRTFRLESVPDRRYHLLGGGGCNESHHRILVDPYPPSLPLPYLAGPKAPYSLISSGSECWESP